jgi:hypothetical protein
MKAALTVVLAALAGGVIAVIGLAIGHRTPVGDDEDVHGGHV